MLGELLRAADADDLQPKIDQCFLFGDTLEAYEYFSSAARIGKIVITG